MYLSALQFVAAATLAILVTVSLAGLLLLALDHLAGWLAARRADRETRLNL